MRSRHVLIVVLLSARLRACATVPLPLLLLLLLSVLRSLSLSLLPPCLDSLEDIAITSLRDLCVWVSVCLCVYICVTVCHTLDGKHKASLLLPGRLTTATLGQASWRPGRRPRQLPLQQQRCFFLSARSVECHVRKSPCASLLLTVVAFSVQPLAIGVW